ncbi:MAG: alpha-amylase family glycosyl hydrolase [Bacteroidota bacterium]
MAQFTKEEIVQGYKVNGATTTFIFDPTIYGIGDPTDVVVTGSFAGWSSNMNETQRILKKGNAGLWSLEIANKDFNIISPAAEFKFRINEGKWLDPPQGANNVKSGNLVFLMGITPPGIKAEIHDTRTIWAEIEGIDRPLSPKEYQLTNAQGEIIEIEVILPNTDTKTLIKPKGQIDIKRVYYLEVPSFNLKTVCSYDGWFRQLYSDKELGANINDGKTTFRIFSPRAELMKLYLYQKAKDEEAFQVVEMKQDVDGVWEAFFDQNLKGVYYDFTVHGPNDPGNHFYGTTPVHISDPYARVSDDTWGKCRVWNKTTPATPLKNGIPKMEELIAYEVHVQDFTDRLPVGDDLKGTIPAMTVPGLKNKKGQKIGFDYLVDLGINTVHLMPVQEFLHYKDEVWKPSFENDPYMIEQGISEENYQWGYRTSHCFAIESRFRQRGTEPGAERNQFRDLVQAFHDKDIAVIIDIVPNHTAENMDAKGYFFHFNVLDKIYYYRTKDLEHIGEYGNEVKTEDRPMVQRWLIDQCKQLIEEFGIDGFRIDLAGQIDEQTLIALKAALGEDIIIYGEPWIGSNDPAYEANPAWDWYKEDSPITFFQDEGRNAFKGPVFDIKSKERDRGYAGGLGELREEVKKGLSNTFKDDKTTTSGISYLDIHDNWALADQLSNNPEWDGRTGADEERIKLAAVMLYTTMGPIVTHGGTEIMRSKAHGPLREVVKEMNDGVKVYLHGKRDTYNMRTANQFVWENVGKTKKDAPLDYKAMHSFWKGLNTFRNSSYGEVFKLSGATRKDHYQWIEPENEHLLGYIVDGKVMVLMNVSDESLSFNDLKVPEGRWKLIGNNAGINVNRGTKDSSSFKKINSETKNLTLAPTSFKLWVKY